ncbi:MAG: M20 family metallopeptidase [Anaerolineae bacterium]|nr:M20 family metallopeptidase [Anaerolineae bacterium]
MTDLLAECRARTDEITALLTTLIEYETFTAEKEAVDAFATALTGMLQALGAAVKRIPRDTVGDILLATWNAEAEGQPITFVGHMDTVWPLGTLAQRPVRVEDGRLYGPGSIDMKAGLAVMLSAIRLLRETDAFPDRPIWALFTSDEEIGSPNSREMIMDVARQSGLCVILEPATPEGAIKTWRKGVSDYHITVTGRASHAGGAPEAGINAVVELAHQIVRVNELNDLRNGTSVSVTVVKGGHASNVIPDHAEADIDVRFLKPEEATRLREGMAALAPRLPGAQLAIRQGDERPPLVRDDQMRQSFQQLKAIGESLGLGLIEDGSGGGSDGNFTAAVGTPTLDGMGPTGEGLHALHENVLISSLPEKTALLAALIQQWQM